LTDYICGITVMSIIKKIGAIICKLKRGERRIRKGKQSRNKY